MTNFPTAARSPRVISARSLRFISFAALWLAVIFPRLDAETRDLGHGFADHGVATPLSGERGIVATVDAQGRDVVLVWLMDHRGCTSLLMIDAETGRTDQFPLPFTLESVDSPFASLLSSRNKYYTLFGSHFVEFDVAKRAFTFQHETTPMMAMSMTEDDRGVIWAATYPKNGVVSYDPRTGVFKDYGQVYPQNWPQYPRFIAADDAGWIYFGLGNTESQIVAFDPATGHASPVLTEADRKRGLAYVYRDLDGKVYGQALYQVKRVAPADRKPGTAYVDRTLDGETYSLALDEPDDAWIELYRGAARKLARHDTFRPKPIIAGPQTLFHTDFPDGKKIEECNPIEHLLIVEDPRTKTTRELHFDYTSEGAIVMAAAAAPDGTICGGTTFPMRFFSYNPRTDQWIHHPAYGQWNTIARFGEKFYAGGYGAGFLLEWNPAQPWLDTRKDLPGNPLFLTDCDPTINRPDRLLPCPDGKTIIMAGTPEYGYTGGGLLFWDCVTRARTLLTDAEVIPDQSTCSLLALPGGKLLGGSTTAPGTGGERKAKEAELYLMDFATKKVEWRQAVFPGVQEYTDLCHAPGGLIYGLADKGTFFVFDPTSRAVIHQTDARAKFGNAFGQQGQRNFVTAPDGTVYLLFSETIVRVEPRTFRLTQVARSPLKIDGGGDYLDGRIYFVCGSHLCSYRVAAKP